MLTEDADNWLLDVLVAALLLVLSAKKDEGEDWEEQVNHVVELGAHFPSRHLAWISLGLEVINSAVQPVSITINLQVVEILELVEGMVLQVVRLNLVIFTWFGLVLESPGILYAS